MSSFSLYFHTLKYLKLSQIIHRFLRRFKYPKIIKVEVRRAQLSGDWYVSDLYNEKFINISKVCFLNECDEVISKADWNSNSKQKLWLYNLHYFDGLNSINASNRRILHAEWVDKWIKDNPVRDGGNGWEPYTISLRIVNWIKAFLSGMEPTNDMLNSLALQADFLSQDLEKHLLGNHYFVNLKALIFAGCFLEGRQSSAWLLLGLKDYESELNEQVMNDGGNFELTPMYHAIMLTDLLDLYNLFNVFSGKIPKHLVGVTKAKIDAMLVWLEAMSHGDDKISFFNDSAFAIAPDNRIIRNYAFKLGFNQPPCKGNKRKLSLIDFQSSGYVSVKNNDFTLLADLAEVGPSYIPGHAHADSLSFEFSLGLSRVFVNSGISCYGASAERVRQRGSSAHNTVVINGMNSSEVWSGFRVARRANIVERSVTKVDLEESVEFSAAHNGYKKQGVPCVHHRTWRVSLEGFEVEDYLDGSFDSAVGYLHLHPDVSVVETFKGLCVLKVNGYELNLKVYGAELSVESSTWHPEFGKVLPSNKLVFQYLKSQVLYQISWMKK